MKVSGSTLLVLLLTIALSLSTPGEEVTRAKALKTQTRPMALTELLSLLPACPDQWSIKRSQARWLYQDNLEAYAVREYEMIIPPEATEPKEVTKPQTVLIVIRDTCGLGPHIEAFRKETAPTVGGDFASGSWGQYPAMMVRLGNHRKSLRVLVSDRFVVELVFSGDNPKALNLWMKQCDLQALTRVKQRSPITIGEKVTLEFLDELHPERTRSYIVPVVPRKADAPTEAASLEE